MELGQYKTHVTVVTGNTGRGQDKAHARSRERTCKVMERKLTTHREDRISFVDLISPCGGRFPRRLFVGSYWRQVFGPPVF